MSANTYFTVESKKDDFLQTYSTMMAAQGLEKPTATIRGLDIRLSTLSPKIDAFTSESLTSAMLLANSKTPESLHLKFDLSEMKSAFTAGMALDFSSLLVPERSFSSQMMSNLMEFRNSKITSVWSKIWHGAKVAMTEAALPFVTVTAAVETLFRKVKYEGQKVVRSLQVRFAPQEKKAARLEEHRKVCVQEPALLRSSRFTISWSALTLKDNLSFKNLTSDEDEARKIYAINKPTAQAV